jgi:formiminotetrahydrofolate cyclodeaminase
MLSKMTIEELLEETAGNSPVPGGGSIAAMSGASAAALTEMVANLTIDKKNYEDVSEHMKEIAAKASKLRLELLDDINRDSVAYSKVMEAFKLPKETDEEKQIRSEHIQKAFKIAATIPLEVARKSKEVIDLAKLVVLKGNKNAITDGAVAAMLARTAALGAIYNVSINLTSIKDSAFVEEVTMEIMEIKDYVVEVEQDIIETTVI